MGEHLENRLIYLLRRCMNVSDDLKSAKLSGRAKEIVNNEIVCLSLLANMYRGKEELYTKDLDDFEEYIVVSEHIVVKLRQEGVMFEPKDPDEELFEDKISEEKLLEYLEEQIKEQE